MNLCITAKYFIPTSYSIDFNVFEISNITSKVHTVVTVLCFAQ